MAFNLALSLSSFIDTFHSLLSKGAKATLSDYSTFETALDNNTIISEKGESYTLLKLHGSLSELTTQEFSSATNTLNKRLTAFFKDNNHSMQFIYRTTPDNDTFINAQYKPILKVARDMQLDISEILQARMDLISNNTKSVSIYILLGTLGGDSKDAIKEETKVNSENRNKMFLDVDSQSLFSQIVSITNKHLSFVSAVNTIFKSSQIITSSIDTGKAINIIRGMFNEKLTAPSWRPSMPGKILNLKLPSNPHNDKNDVSDLLWEKVSTQIFPSGIENIKRNICQVSGVYYYSIEVTIPPQTIMSFNELAASIPHSLSAQFSISLVGGGQSLFSMKKLLASFGAAISSQNKSINDSFNVLKEINSFHGESLVSWKMSAVAWAQTYEEAKTSGDSLVGIIQTWGSPMVIPARIGSIQGLMNAMPIGMPSTSSGLAVAPLYSAINTLPIDKVFCPWAYGACTFMSSEGTPYNFQPGSSKQTTWNDIIFAVPGSGKSVLMNYLNFATVLTPGNDRLPFVGIVDIGFSSKGLIDLIKNSLPANKRHQAVYHQLENNSSSTINIFDTQLGLRFPTSEEEAFQINFITLLLTPPGQKSPFDTASSIATMVIRDMYKFFSDSGSMVRHYEEYLNEELDNFIVKNNILVHESTTWWNIVDSIFKIGNIEMAKLAQRYAVPRLQECVSILRQSDSIKDMYGKIELVSKESVLDAFSRSISESLNKYKLLTGVTTVSFDSAKILSLDLQKVALQGNTEAQHQSAVMYLISRYIIGRNFFVDNETITAAPDIYKDYHSEIVSSIKSVKKRICYDEFHRTAGIESIENQVIRDMREGRKWNIQIALASQMLDDFSENICDMATCTYIMSGGHNYSKIARKFNLSASTSESVRTDLTGPSSSGTPFVFVANTKVGRIAQLLNFMATPDELWAFNTNAEDYELKNMLIVELGFSKAIESLAKHFPGGSAQDKVSLYIDAGRNKQEAKIKIFDDIIISLSK
jgi:intracellular multiplication protein IcmB